MWALRKVARTYLNIPHGRDRGYFGAGLGAEDAVYFTYTRTKVTTPCAEIARSRRVADQSRSRTAEQCLRPRGVGATRERAMRAAIMREPLHASAVASPRAGRPARRSRGPIGTMGMRPESGRKGRRPQWPPPGSDPQRSAGAPLPPCGGPCSALRRAVCVVALLAKPSR